MIERKTTAEELWKEATSSYLDWSGSDWPEVEWVGRAKSTLYLYKEYLKLSEGKPTEIKCRAQIGRVLFEGATHLGENKRIAQEGIDKLVNASRSLAELEKALLLDAQRGIGLFRDPGQQELYLPILESLWTMQASHLENTSDVDNAISYLEKKISLIGYLGEPQMAGACNQLGILHAKEKRDDLAIVWFQKAIHVADACQRDSKIYEFYQRVKGKAQKNTETILASSAPHPQNGRFKVSVTGNAATRPAQNTTALPSQALIEKLFDTSFPDWQALLRSAKMIKQQMQPFGLVRWAEREAMHSSRALRAVEEYDIWAMDDGLCLYRHQRIGCLVKILGLLLVLLARLLSPLIHLKRAIWARIKALIAGIVGPFYVLGAAFETLLLSLAGRLGHWFAYLGIPLAILGFMIDIFNIFLSVLRAMLSLLAQPFLLLREIVFLPFRIFLALLSRLIKTFLMAWIARLLDTAAQKVLEMMLRRCPWLRGIILGFLRRDRPPFPVIIPRRSVSQILLMKRRGLFGAREFLVVVEGDALQISFKTWLKHSIKKLVFPFYWERTIHIFGLTRKERERIIQCVCQALGKPAIPWK